MIDKTIGYGYNDLTVVPAVSSSVSSRKECNPFNADGNLPIFTAPMSSVINENNIQIWEANKIIPIIPRSVNFEDRIKYFNDEKFRWVAVSMAEFTDLFILKNPVTYLNYRTTEFFVLIDVANGHMESLYDMCNTAHELADKYGYTLHLMIGNIANPETYDYICRNVKCEYVRIGIGGGSGCTTSSNTSVHYPMATLINECANIKDNLLSMNYQCPAIIADGGIRNYCDVIKALALGADYVMIGGLFAGLLESAGTVSSIFKDFYYNEKTGQITIFYGPEESEEDNEEFSDDIYNIWDLNEDETRKRNLVKYYELYKEFYGMSTKTAQKLINKDAKLKTAEGCHKTYEVKATINQWTENMIDYLKSAMSYTGKRSLNEFINNVTLKVNSACEIMAVNK